MPKFTPENPHGLLFDAEGNVVYRFGRFDTSETHEAPDYVEPNHAPDYVSGPAEHDAEGYPLEAHPNRSDLPDPASPPSGDNPAPEFDV